MTKKFEVGIESTGEISAKGLIKSGLSNYGVTIGTNGSNGSIVDFKSFLSTNNYDIRLRASQVGPGFDGGGRLDIDADGVSFNANYCRLPSDTSIGGVTGTEIGYLEGLFGSVQGQIEFIKATKVESSLVMVTTGWLTAATGWGSVSGTYTEKNGIVMVNLRATRTGASIAAGNITNVNVMTITAGYRPLVEAAGISGPSGPLASCYIATTGGVVISALGTAISTGDAIDINATYIKG
jgi:hypothetical protein